MLSQRILLADAEVLATRTLQTTEIQRNLHGIAGHETRTADDCNDFQRGEEGSFDVSSKWYNYCAGQVDHVDILEGRAEQWENGHFQSKQYGDLSGQQFAVSYQSRSGFILSWHRAHK